MIIDNSNLKEEDEAKVLEWYAKKCQLLLQEAGILQISTKKDIILIDIKTKTVRSFLLDSDVKYNSLSEVEDLIDEMIVKYASELIEEAKKDLLRNLKVKNPEIFL